MQPDTKPLIQSTTVWGALFAAASALLSPNVLAQLPAKYANAGMILGSLISAIGMRKAVANAGQ